MSEGVWQSYLPWKVALVSTDYAAEADMAHAAIDHLRVARRRAVASAIVRRAQKRAALDDLALNTDLRLGRFGAEECGGQNRAALPPRTRTGQEGQAALRSSSSIWTFCGPRKKAMRTPGRMVFGSTVNSAPFCFSSATTASMPSTRSPICSSPR